MANPHIYSHSPNVLSWDTATIAVTAISNNATIDVYNSYGNPVYWTQGGNNGSISAPSGYLTCTQGAADKTWSFSESSGGTVRITLTVTGAGNGPQ